MTAEQPTFRAGKVRLYNDDGSFSVVQAVDVFTLAQGDFNVPVQNEIEYVRALLTRTMEEVITGNDEDGGEEAEKSAKNTRNDGDRNEESVPGSPSGTTNANQQAARQVLLNQASDSSQDSSFIANNQQAAREALRQQQQTVASDSIPGGFETRGAANFRRSEQEYQKDRLPRQQNIQGSGFFNTLSNIAAGTVSAVGSGVSSLLGGSGSPAPVAAIVQQIADSANPVETATAVIESTTEAAASATSEAVKAQDAVDILQTRLAVVQAANTSTPQQVAAIATELEEAAVQSQQATRRASVATEQLQSMVDTLAQSTIATEINDNEEPPELGLSTPSVIGSPAEPVEVPGILDNAAADAEALRAELERAQRDEQDDDERKELDAGFAVAFSGSDTTPNVPDAKQSVETGGTFTHNSNLYVSISPTPKTVEELLANRELIRKVHAYDRENNNQLYKSAYGQAYIANGNIFFRTNVVKSSRFRPFETNSTDVWLTLKDLKEDPGEAKLLATTPVSLPDNGSKTDVSVQDDGAESDSSTTSNATVRTRTRTKNKATRSEFYPYRWMVLYGKGMLPMIQEADLHTVGELNISDELFEAFVAFCEQGGNNETQVVMCALIYAGMKHRDLRDNVCVQDELDRWLTNAPQAIADYTHILRNVNVDMLNEWLSEQDSISEEFFSDDKSADFFREVLRECDLEGVVKSPVEHCSLLVRVIAYIFGCLM